jgi:hypothetical protein
MALYTLTVGNNWVSRYFVQLSPSTLLTKLAVHTKPDITGFVVRERRCCLFTREISTGVLTCFALDFSKTRVTHFYYSLDLLF